MLIGVGEAGVKRDFPSSGNLKVEPVNDKQALARFLEVPSLIYRGLSGFDPGLLLEQEMALAPKKGVFFKSGKAKYWLAKRGKRVVGRISAQVAGDIPRGLPTSTGMFGCFDVEDDLEVVQVLLSAAEQWLKEQGCTHAFGPCTLNMNGEAGVLIKGQDEPRMSMTPWNPAFTANLVERCGYVKRKDILNWSLNLKAIRNEGFRNRVKPEALGPQAKIRNLDKKNIKRDIQFICDIYNDAWQENELFVPLKPIDLRDMEKSLKPILPPDACVFVEVDGKPAGVAVVIPNFFEVTRGLKTRPGALGWAKLGWRLLRHNFLSGRIILLGVSRRYNKTVRGMAIAVALIDQLLKSQEAHRGHFVEAGWVLEDNAALNALLRQFNFSPSKKFRLYIKALA